MNIYFQYKNILNTAYAALVLLISCNSPESAQERDKTVAKEANSVVLTGSQIKQADIQIGTFSFKEAAESFRANGIIEVPPNNIVSVVPIFEGFVQNIRFLEGAEVKKGQVLVELKNPAYIRMQQDFIQTASRLRFLEQELERQQTLSDAEVGARRQLQQVQSEYNSAKANLASLREQLLYLDINPQSILKGDIRSSVYLKAPFNGTVTSVSAIKGEMVSAGREIMKVVDREHMHLELQVFQKNIPNVAQGQKLEFNIPAFENGKIYKGYISLVGQNIDPDMKTIKVHAHFIEDPLLIPGLYAEATIYYESIKKRMLPEEAVFRHNGTWFFFVKESESSGGVKFKAVEFEPGLTSENFIELKKFDIAVIPDTTAIVVKGAFYLKAELNKELRD
jgi:membrane fusion protein, heavy metal efflux system